MPTHPHTALGFSVSLPDGVERTELSADAVLFRWAEQSLEVRRGEHATLAAWHASLALLGEATLEAAEPTTLCDRPAKLQRGTVQTAGGRGWQADPGQALGEVDVPARTWRVGAVVSEDGRRVAWKGPTDGAGLEEILASIECEG